MDAREDQVSGDPAPLRFSMLRMMQAVTLFCLILGSGAWFFVGWPLAVVCVFIAMQLPLMLLVRKHLTR
jgi:hypothetical protein